MSKTSVTPDAGTLAIAVLAERIGALSEEDKQDLFDLTKALFTATTQEELDSASITMQEIIEQNSGNVVLLEQILKKEKKCFL